MLNNHERLTLQRLGTKAANYHNAIPLRWQFREQRQREINEQLERNKQVREKEKSCETVRDLR